MTSHDSYRPRPGLSVPLVTVLDSSGEVLESEQRELVRFVLQNGNGADILFAAGTTGEWDRIANNSRQKVTRIVVDEARSAARKGHQAEVWAGITAHSRAETLENLKHAIAIGADAAVVAPLSIVDVSDSVQFMIRDIGGVFEMTGRSIPIFLYDNAEIAAPGHAPHMRTRDVKRMSRLDYVRGVKVSASKQVLGNYTKAASQFRSSGEFAIYAGDPHLIFDLFAPPVGLRGRLRDYWNRYLTRRALPAGVVAGPSNVFPREWKRSWAVCRAGDERLMRSYEAVLREFKVACVFPRGRRNHKPTIACLKAALAEMDVISSRAVAPGTPTLDENDYQEFVRRFREIRHHASEHLEPQWISQAHRDRAAAAGA